MGAAEGRYREAGGALEEYAGALDRAQSDSLNALAAAKSAQADAMDARTRAERMRASAEEYPADGDGGDDRARYMRLAGAADADEAAAQERIAAQKEIIDRAVSERDIAAERAIEIIDGACGDGLADSWWDDWGKAITQWIAKICEIVSGIAGVLALLVSWVPIVGQALAAFLGAHNLRHDPQGVLASAVAALKFKGSGRTDLPKGLYEGRGKNHGSAAARAYEEQITGYPVEYSIYVEGDLAMVEFDGFRDGVLLDAKGPRTYVIISHHWSTKALEKMLKQMRKQVNAVASGGLDIPIHWHFAEKEAMEIAAKLEVPPGIKLFYTPPK